MVYHLAPALVQLRSEVNAIWPGRSKVSDGWIGDTSHSARVSDHNPDYGSGGVVRAIDITTVGIDTDALLQCAITDRRTAYAIFRGLIYVRDRGFRAERYTGANSHHHHLHISIRHGASYETSTASWGLAKRAGHGGSAVAPPALNPTPAPVPVPDVQEDDMTPEQDARLKAVESKLAQLGATQEIVFFESAGTVYEASLLSGTYRALPSKATLTDRKAVLGAAGIAYRNWSDSVGNREVANPGAFGIRVG